MSYKAIQLKSPKLGCIPVRPFLIFISFLELIWTLSYLITEPPSTFDVFICTLGAAVNVYLIYGTLKYNDKALGYSQICVIFTIILSFAMLCFLPVFYTSVISSDYHKYLKAERSESSLQLSADVDEITKVRQMIFFDENNFSAKARKILKGDNRYAAGVKFLAGFFAGEMIVFVCAFYFLYSLVVYVMIKRLRKFIAARKEMYGKEFLA